jgi:preprotein translocase subunit SecG
MAFLIGLLTLVMVLDCLLLILLVLIQLPKKDAGAGLAFGSGATDALFGAGSGTVLTKITKYAAAAFFVMALFLSLLQSNYHRRTGTQFEDKLKQQEQATLPTTAPMGTPAQTTTSTSAVLAPPRAEATNIPQTTTPAVTSTAPTLPAATNQPNAAPAPK